MFTFDNNCTLQNKNITMLHYLFWRVMIGLHRSIVLSFLVVGHTKFSPDRCFGLLSNVPVAQELVRWRITCRLLTSLQGKCCSTGWYPGRRGDSSNIQLVRDVQGEAKKNQKVHVSALSL